MDPRARYLLPEAFRLFKHFCTHHPFPAGLLVLFIYGSVLQLLRWRFRRSDADVLVFAGVVTLIVLIFGSAFYTLIHVKGFHFGG